MDGYIMEYRWESDIDGFLSDQTSFGISTLSVNLHTITFKVKDNNGTWSHPVKKAQTIGVMELLEQYFPHLIFDEVEEYYPCNFYNDDDDIDDNPYRYSTSWPLTCYVHTTEISRGNEDYLVLEYWFYYAKDTKFWDTGFLGAHDHDWESVYIYLDKSDYSPEFITYFHHIYLDTGNDKYVTYEWDSSSFDKIGNHPTIHVARGSHASYGDTFLDIGGWGLVTIPEFCDGGKKFDFDDFARAIKLVNEPDSTWPQEEFGTIDAPWNRIRWDNPVDMLEKMETESYTFIAMEEPQSKLYFHIYDNQSRHVGKNYITNETDFEIPGCIYFDLDNKTVITIPQNLTEFKLVVDADYAHENVEEYNITIRTIRDGKIIDEDSIVGTINKGEQHEFNATLDEETGEIISIPEFSTLIMLPMLMILTLAIVTLKKRENR